SLYRLYILETVQLIFRMIRNPPISTLFPTRRSSDLRCGDWSDGTAFAFRRTLPQGNTWNYCAGCSSLAGAWASAAAGASAGVSLDRKSTRLNSSHVKISYAVFCLKKKIHSKRSSKHL